jgi:hypothetical protein
MRCMAALAVIEYLHVCKHRRLGLLVHVKVLQRDQLRFSGVEETLCHRVVPAVALAAHTRLYPVLGQERPRAVDPLRTATVGMHDQPCCRLALGGRHGQRLGHEFRPPMVGHGPPDHGPRAQLQDDGELQPACACGKGGDIPHLDRSRGGHSTLPMALVRSDRLGLPCSRWGFACTPGCAAQPRRVQHAPKAAAAHPQALLRSQRLAPARAVETTPLCNILLDFRLSLLSGVRLNAGRPAAPLVVTTARALQYPTQTRDGKLRVLLLEPGVLPGSCCAQDAAAFCKISRSSFQRAFAFRRRLSSSYRCASWPCFSWRSTRCYVPIQVWNVFSLTPKSRAVWASGCSDSTASFTARSLHAAGEPVIAGVLIVHTSQG